MTFVLNWECSKMERDSVTMKEIYCNPEVSFLRKATNIWEIWIESNKFI